MRSADTDAIEEFVTRTAALLHAHGAPAHRLEAALGRLARVLGVPAEVFSSPTSLLIAFGNGPQQRTRMLRVEPGGFDLGKLVEFDAVLDELEHGRLDLGQARARLEEIAAARPRHATFVMDAAHGVAAASAAVFFGGTWPEVGAALGVGCVLGVLSRMMGRGEAARLYEPVAALVATTIAAVLARGVLPIRDPLVVLAGLIVLLPGLTFTFAMIELTTRQLISGTTRLAGAATVFLALAFGVAAGRTIVGLLLPPVTPTEAEPLPGWAVALALPAASWAFAVLLAARPSELGWIAAAAVIGWGGGVLGQAHFGAAMGSFVGALGVGLFANAFARTRDKPASVLVTPGLLVLVPGSVGYRALDLFLANDPLAGMQTGFQMIIAGTSLVAGLLCANVVLPPRRSL